MHDLSERRSAILRGQTSAAAEIEISLAAAQAPAARNAFLSIDATGARAAARAAEARPATDAPPLAGLAVSIKDLYDIAGQVTTAGSTVLADRPAATHDGVSVARLRAAGAALIGRTHMTEFAFSGVGLNPHHATPANVAMAALGQPDCIPGGSTSGGAVSVAAGAAWAALGSDTGGSIRIPAALHGLVGFKNTQRLTSNDGSVPLAPSLDTACAITRSVRDAVVLHEVLAARQVALPRRPLAGLRLGLVTPYFLDELEPTVDTAFRRALGMLTSRGASLVDLLLSALADIGALQVSGGLPAAESWAWHRELIESRGGNYDPRVAMRIRRGASITSEQVDALHAARARWIAKMNHDLAGVDVVIAPTVPIIAPRMAALDSDDAFFRVNALLLRNPSVVNLLDGCAISLPCHAPGEPPVGLMLWQRGGQDDALLDAALAVEHALSDAFDR